MNISGYQIIREIGQGGMAAVYLARHEVSQDQVAVKVMHANLIADKSLVERFLREGRTHAGFDHPQIIRIFEVGQLDDGRPYFTMEYLEGDTLKDFLARQGRLSPGDAFQLLSPIMSALAYVHGKRFIHRDVKPENIFLCRERGAVLMDFGITKEADRNTRFTEAGMAVGTPHYMSPEQARGEATDHRTDIYAMGIVLYEALAGRVPFDGKESIAIAIKHIQELAPPLPADVSNYQPVIDKALAKDPDQRYGSVVALQQDFQRGLAGEILTPFSATSQSSTATGISGTRIMPSAGREINNTSRKKLVWLVAGLLLVAVGGSAFYYFMFGGSRRPVIAQSGGGGGSVAANDSRNFAPSSSSPVPTAPVAQLSQSLDQKWQELKPLIASDPVMAAKKYAELMNRTANDPVDVSRAVAIRRQADPLFSQAALQLVSNNQVFSPGGRCAGDVLKHWAPLAMDQGQVDRVLKPCLLRYADLAQKNIQSGTPEKSKSYIASAKRLAGISSQNSATLLSSVGITKLEGQIASLDKQVAEQRRQISQKRSVAKEEIDRAWQLLTQSRPWQAREKVRQAEALGATADDLSGIRRALDIAVKERKRQGQGLMNKARQAYEERRYSQVISYCDGIDPELKGDFPDIAICDTARREKQNLTNKWQSQNDGPVSVQKVK